MNLRGTDQGFTLIELLVVITIIAAASVVLPVALAGLPRVRLHRAADEMVATLHELRDEAQYRGITAEFKLDPSARTYTTSPGGETITLARVVERVEGKVGLVEAGGGNLCISFFPDGSSSGGEIILDGSSKQEVIVVDWLSGHVRRGR